MLLRDIDRLSQRYAYQPPSSAAASSSSSSSSSSSILHTSTKQRSQRIQQQSDEENANEANINVCELESEKAGEKHDLDEKHTATTAKTAHATKAKKKESERAHGVWEKRRVSHICSWRSEEEENKSEKWWGEEERGPAATTARATGGRTRTKGMD